MTMDLVVSESWPPACLTNVRKRQRRLGTKRFERMRNLRHIVLTADVVKGSAT
jgi:hypothetical protein